MVEEIFAEMVIKRLGEMREMFALTEQELELAIDYAHKIGFCSAKPSRIALSIIRIVKPEIPNSMIYKQGHTEFQTIRKWTTYICLKLKIKQNFFKGC